jgi:SAM-dependent methyltransferase
VKVPSPTVHPLDNNDELIRLLCEATGEPRSLVIQRLIDEEACLGTNVRRDLKNAGVRPHVWSDQLVDFYRTTRSFLYETSVWNRAPLKLEMRDWIGRFLAERAPGRRLRVLSFGDGLGFDSVYLAAAGHDVTYYEVADECVHFAKQVFAANQQSVNIVQSADSLPAGAFDVVISLDVLEHVPSPPECVGMFARWLKPGGWLLAHSPFFFTSWHRVTHLKSSRKYSGCKELYRQQGLHPVDGRFFWDPIALEKASLPTKNSDLGAVNLGGLLLKFGRYSNVIHCAIAQMKAGTDRRWRDDLVRRFQVTESV